MYFVGLFLMTIGIAISVKSNFWAYPLLAPFIYHDLCLGH